MRIKIFLLISIAVSSLLLAHPAQAAQSKPISFQAEVWADNWFALYVNGKKIGEDSVPITTERSFNSEKIEFTATYPLTIGIIAKDFVEDSTGLEYIGKPNQQIGDAGLILQIREKNSAKVITATGKDWKVLTINRAPLNPECEKSSNPAADCKYSNTSIPKGWNQLTFKDKLWKYAKEFTEQAVGVKEGFFDISWAPSAKLIWSEDLRLDNTILLRKIIK